MMLNGGGSWIRTNEGRSPTDLQSVAFGHSAIPPQIENKRISRTHETVNKIPLTIVNVAPTPPL
jgi:hypothetical protein